MTEVQRVSQAFRQAYGDVLVDSPRSTRKLTWRATQRIPLSDAADVYAQIRPYNAFHPRFLHDLADRFPGVTVTCAREQSVAVYLHVPRAIRLAVCTEVVACIKTEPDECLWTKSDTLRLWWD